jgi:hypothetical protein
MTVIDKILSEWSYRCSDGIVDMNNPTKVAILEEIMGFTMDELKKDSTKTAIEAILNDPLSQGKLDRHSRSKRIKNIGNISNNDFIDIISNIFGIPTEDIQLLKPKSEDNPSSRNYSFKFPFGETEANIVLGTEATGKDIEEIELNNINSIIKENGGSIDILVKSNKPESIGKLYPNITEVKKISGNKQADFEFIGKENLFVQHKDLKGSQQYSGIFDISSEPEVADFIETVKKQTKDNILQPKQNYKRNIKDKELKLLAAYGRGKEFGEDKVQIICFGNITLEKNEDGQFEIKSPKYFVYPESPDDGYEPYIYVTYRTGMNQQGIKNARFGFYPEKYYRAAKEQ